ncbi:MULTISPECIES: hypothetical protein [unclassified Clostridium]|jgi:hypothetical protein|uniref:hypothetical protein n=1 Tax=unclassified Clostridium TaxID=2614128 RepID=UPI0011068D22|nr:MULTISPECIES: hypothetical protein [unclassified Clostridium]
MKRNPARMLLCAGLCAAAVIGTGVMSYAASWSSSGSETAQTDNRMTPRDDGSVMAKITAAGDGSLTVTFALKPEQRDGDGTGPAEDRAPDRESPPEKPAEGETLPEKRADGETPPEKPADGENPPAQPEEEGTMPAMPEGGNPWDRQGSGGMTMEFSTDETTVYLTGSTVITKGMEGREGTESDLAVGSIVRMILEDTQIISIDIME